MKPKKNNPKIGVFRVLYGSKTKISLLICVFIISVFAILLSNWLMTSQTAFAKIDLLQPAPTQPLGYYDYFGKLLSPQEASQLVANKRLDPNDPISYQRVGAVKITQELIAKGEDIFFNRKIGDTFGLQEVFGFALGFTKISNELGVAIASLQGQPTTNLKIILQKDLTVGSRTFPKGTVIPTGLKIPKGQSAALGLTASGNITCAICHATLSNSKIIPGVPNGELAIPCLLP